MGGGTKTTTTQAPQPTTPALQSLTNQAATEASRVLGNTTMDEFLKASPTKVAGLSAREQEGYGKIKNLGDLARRRITGETIQSSPSFIAANQAFDTAVMPTIENQAAVSGLGRSTALTNASAAARAAYLQPTVESALTREQAGLDAERSAEAQEIAALTGAGATERGIEQAGYESEAADQQRRQALAEQALYQPLGQLIPTAFGQQSKTTGKTGIFA